MAEWFKAAVLKTAFQLSGTGVRIPLPPSYRRDTYLIRGLPFYDCETQALGYIILFSVFYGCLGFSNHPSIRAIMRTITFDLGS